MKNKINGLALAVVLVLALSSGVQAQTITGRTSLTAALSATGTTITVVSTAGMTAPTATQFQYVYIDGELMRVTSITDATHAVVTRGGQNIPTVVTPHLSGATVWTGPSQVFQQNGVTLSGQCTRSQQLYLPIIDPREGRFYDCILSTTGTTANWVSYGGSPGTSLARPYKKLAVTATTYTLLPVDHTVGYNSNVNGTITIPALTGMIGKEFFLQIEVTGTHSLTIATSSGQLINGATSIAIGGSTSFSGVRVYSDGQNWFAARAH